MIDPAAAEGDEFGEFVFGESGLFAGSLDFDELAAARHDEIHVDGGGDVFAVVEVEKRLAVDEADAYGGDVSGEDA